jgi:hypothetical protein
LWVVRVFGDRPGAWTALGEQTVQRIASIETLCTESSLTEPCVQSAVVEVTNFTD